MLAPAIISINSDVSLKVIPYIKKQLFITEHYDGYVFDSIIQLEPNFPNFVIANNERILVSLPSQFAFSVNLFYKEGIVSINNCKAFHLRDLYLGQLNIFANPYIQITNSCCNPPKCLKSYQLLQKPCGSCGFCKTTCSSCSSCSCNALIPIYSRV
jgi:hypothetical protein